MVYLLCIDTRVTLQEYRPIYTTHYNCNVYYQHFLHIHNAVSVFSLSFTPIYVNQTDESFADEFRIWKVATEIDLEYRP